MAILTYDEVKDKASTLRAMTSLDRDEFEALAVTFGETWAQQEEQAGREASKGGRPPQLKGIEEKLFFILFYLKTYPLQEVLGHLFGLSQGQANQWVHRLSEVLKVTLERQGCRPARLPEEGLARLADEELQEFGIDGTERRIQRPKDDEQQRQHYSGKKKTHTVKNNLVAGLVDRTIKYLSDTHEGKKHDKKIGDEDGIRTPEGSSVYRDTGFQGHEMAGVVIYQPKKKPRGGELSADDKAHNRLISSVRIVIEHVIAGVKRCRIVKDVFRNTKEGYADIAMELACGLHNFRTDCRLLEY
jgi:hypothetical protein